MSYLTKTGRLLTLLSVLSVALFCRASADPTLWYNGDFNGVTALSNEENSSIADSRVYDNFNVTGSGWHITSIWSNDLVTSDFQFAQQATWSIRSGVSAGNGGMLIASGISAATETPTGRGRPTQTEEMFRVSGLKINLTPGTYWLQVTPIGMGTGRSFISTTSGANAIGTPPGNDGNSFWDSTSFNKTFASTPFDFSMGVAGTLVPEGSALLLFTAGSLPFCIAYGYRRYRK